MTDSNTITVNGVTFDNVHYDADADVLYLHIGKTSSAVSSMSPPRATTCASMRMSGSWASPSSGSAKTWRRLGRSL